MLGIIFEKSLFKRKKFRVLFKKIKKKLTKNWNVYATIVEHIIQDLSSVVHTETAKYWKYMYCTNIDKFFLTVRSSVFDETIYLMLKRSTKITILL